MMDVTNLGQVFTPVNIVEQMMSLRVNKGLVLEPSCGDGAFFNQLGNECVGIEYDSSKCPKKAINMDFFDYPVENQFETVIGNPPYVKYQHILDDTKRKLDCSLFDERTNLYLFFIHKCFLHLKDGGELIFIVPKDFLKATSSLKLNQLLYDNGTFTHLIDLSDQNIFGNYTPDCVIFRYVKGCFDRKMVDGRYFTCHNGFLNFTKERYSVALRDLFDVKVGALSGANDIFEHHNGNVEMVFSKTITTNETKRFFYNVPADELIPFKEELLKRRVKKITEETWYEWGRGFYQSDKNRIYVNCRTRVSNPFYIHSCKGYDNSVLALFPKFDFDLELAKDLLNQVDWNDLGFKNGGRFIFSQKSLENCLLPESFRALF